MWIDTTYRSQEEEIMDDLDMFGEILIDSLDKIATINKWLGGNKLTLAAVEKLLKSTESTREVSIVDLGCGNGDMLRALADSAHQSGRKYKLLGIDANQATIDYAIELSKDYDNIKYLKLNVLEEEFKSIEYDVALCTLFLHHFEDETAVDLLDTLNNKSTIGVIVNDLHRHPMAYFLFSLITLFAKNKMMKEDGKLSIRKGFKKKDFIKFSEKIKAKSEIVWKWAFRYQWIMYKK
jgi:2-polyprenyl-3-methyl-5-hydroxy-6-metoxy-1,4-benzoquinol methylase